MIKTKCVYKKDSYSAYDAHDIARLCSKFNCEVSFLIENKKANGKSLIGLCSMQFENGTEFNVVCDGTDERIAFNNIKDFFNN